MPQFALGEQSFSLDQCADNRPIGIAVLTLIVKHTLTGKNRHAVEINPALIDGKRHFNIVLHSQFKVILAVARRDVDQPRAGFIGNKITRALDYVEVITVAV